MSSFLQAIRAESPECLKLSLGVRPAKAAPHRRRPPALSQQTIDHLIAIFLRDMKRGLLDLPTLPDVAQRVRRLVEDDQTSVAQIAMFLSLDPALSARLLHVANSILVYYRLLAEPNGIRSSATTPAHSNASLTFCTPPSADGS